VMVFVIGRVIIGEQFSGGRIDRMDVPPRVKTGSTPAGGVLGSPW